MKKPWLRPHPPGAVAAGAGGGLGARRAAGARAVLAGERNRDLHRDLGARVGLFERDLQVVAQVAAAGGTGRAALAASEHLAENVAEHLVEDVVHVGKAGAAVHAVDAGVTEAIVGGALLLVGEDLEGLVDLLEPPRRLLAAVVAVRMVLHRELAVRGLQAGVIGAAIHPEDVVIISHGSVSGPRVSLKSNLQASEVGHRPPRCKARCARRATLPAEGGGDVPQAGHSRRRSRRRHEANRHARR